MSTYIKELGQKAKAAAADLAGLTRQEKNACRESGGGSVDSGCRTDPAGKRAGYGGGSPERGGRSLCRTA